MSIADWFRPKWRSSRPEVRRAAVGSLTDEALVTEIAQNDSEPNVRREAVLRIADQQVLATIAKNDADADVRSAAVGRITDQVVLAALANTANDPVILAKLACSADSALRETAIIRLRRSLCDERDERVCRDVVASLSSSDGVGALLEFMGVENGALRVFSATALGELGDPRAIERLVESLGDGARDVRRAAANALKKLNAVDALVTALDHSELEGQEAAAQALVELNAVDALTRAASSPNEAIRKNAATLLAHVRG